MRAIFSMFCCTLSVAVPLLAQQGSVADAIEAARAGGVVIACRHGITDQTVDENEATLRYDDPSTQRLLNEEGEQQSRDLGAAFRTLGIRASEVIASPMQRARLSAELMFGQVTTDSLWHTRGSKYAEDKQQRRKAVLRTPVAEGNRFIVSHVGTLTAVLSFKGTMSEGDCVVVRPRGDDYLVIGLVPWRAWMKENGRSPFHDGGH